jgi:hypothetical protein
LIDDDPCKPSRELGFPVILIEVSESLQNGVLCFILGILPIVQVTASNIDALLPVPADQFAKSTSITMSCQVH